MRSSRRRRANELQPELGGVCGMVEIIIILALLPAYVSYSNPSFDYGALHQRFRQCGDESD